MQTSTLVAVLLVMAVVAYLIGRSRSFAVSKPLGGPRHLNSLPYYYGMQTALWCALPSFSVLLLWQLFDDSLIRALVLGELPVSLQPSNHAEASLLLNTIENILRGSISDPDPAIQQAAHHLASLRSTSQMAATALVISLTIAGGLFAWWRISPEFRARTRVEATFKYLLMACSLIAILTTVGIVLSVLFESIRFFNTISAIDFLFGLNWSPQMAIREDQVGSTGAFGAVPLFVGTLLISAIAMFVAVPVGLMSAIYLSEYATSTVRTVVKPILEILAGIPTVVYGFFAALTVAPMIRDGGAAIGLAISSESALAAGLVMGVMIIPLVSSLSDDVINAVPQSLRDGSLGLGATQSETIKQVVLPAALPGIVGGILLAVSRAIGETMIVVMAAGLAAKLTINPLESVTTITVQIVTLLVGDQEFDSPKTLAAFALGLMLFVTTLALNFVALHVVKKYREQYD